MTENTIIIACLVIPFIISSIVEAFVHKEIVKTIIYSVLLWPVFLSLSGVVAIWLNLKNGILNCLLVSVLLFVYVVAVIIMAETLQILFGIENPDDNSRASEGDSREEAQIPENKHTQNRAPENTVREIPEKSLLTRFEEAVSHSNEEEAFKLGAELLNNGDSDHVIRGYKKLAEKGFTQSKDQYVNLVYKDSRTQRIAGKKLGDYSRITIRIKLSQLDDAISKLDIQKNETNRGILNRLIGEKMCWCAIAKDHPHENREAVGRHRTNASQLLGELLKNPVKDADIQECISFVEARGIKPQYQQKPALQSDPPKKPSVPQTLKKCLRCGKALTGPQCGACYLDHTKGSIHLLVRVESRDLQISK